MFIHENIFSDIFTILNWLTVPAIIILIPHSLNFTIVFFKVGFLVLYFYSQNNYNQFYNAWLVYLNHSLILCSEDQLFHPF